MIGGPMTALMSQTCLARILCMSTPFTGSLSHTPSPSLSRSLSEAPCTSSALDGTQHTHPRTLTHVRALTHRSLTTLATVGYGDITPCNEMEQLYTTAAMVCVCVYCVCVFVCVYSRACAYQVVGSAMFAYIVGSISTVAMASNGQELKMRENILQLQEYLSLRRIPNHILPGSDGKHVCVCVCMCACVWLYVIVRVRCVHAFSLIANTIT